MPNYKHPVPNGTVESLAINNPSSTFEAKPRASATPSAFSSAVKILQFVINRRVR